MAVSSENERWVDAPICALPPDHSASRDAPTLIYDSAAWVLATAYDDLKLAYEREAALADQRAAEVEQAERRGQRSGYEQGFNEGQRGD